MNDLNNITQSAGVVLFLYFVTTIISIGLGAIIVFLIKDLAFFNIFSMICAGYIIFNTINGIILFTLGIIIKN